MFLHDCVNAIWNLKWIEGLYLSTLVTFLRKVFLITLQRMQASFILSWAIAIGLATSWLSPLHDTPPITTANLLQAINFWHINTADLPTTGGRLWTWRAFHSYFEPPWCPITSPFSFILLLCTFPSSMVCFIIKHYRSLMIKRDLLGCTLYHLIGRVEFIISYLCLTPILG